MRLSVLQENLAKGLSIVGRAVASRNTLPVLANVALSTDKGQLKLTATNLEIGISHWLGAKVEQEGKITVPAKLLTDIVNSLPNERIDLRLDEKTQTLNLKCGRFDSNIKGLDYNEFPLVSTAEDGEGAIKLDPTALRAMIDHVVFSAATDESRPILTGVLLQFNGDNLTMAAADGYRLSVKTATVMANEQDITDIVIPARALNELSRVSGNQEDPIEVLITPARKQILFHLSNIDLVSQMIEGKFPDYQQIIPKSHTTRTTMNTNDFLKAVKLSYLFARDSANIVKMNITPANGDSSSGKLILTANSVESGDNKAELDAMVDGEGLQIAFNAKYMIDFLAATNEPQIVLETTSESSPGLFKPVGDDSFTHVIMPMHINR